MKSTAKNFKTPHRLARPAGIFRMLYQPGVYPHYRKFGTLDENTHLAHWYFKFVLHLSRVLLLRIPSRQIERKCRIRCHF